MQPVPMPCQGRLGPLTDGDALLPFGWADRHVAGIAAQTPLEFGKTDSHQATLFGHLIQMGDAFRLGITVMHQPFGGGFNGLITLVAGAFVQCRQARAPLAERSRSQRRPSRWSVRFDSAQRTVGWMDRPAGLGRPIIPTHLPIYLADRKDCAYTGHRPELADMAGVIPPPGLRPQGVQAHVVTASKRVRQRFSQGMPGRLSETLWN